MVGLILNFECGQICTIGGLFASAISKIEVVNLCEKWLIWAIISCTIFGTVVVKVPLKVVVGNAETDDLRAGGPFFMISN